MTPTNASRRWQRPPSTQQRRARASSYPSPPWVDLYYVIPARGALRPGDLQTLRGLATDPDTALAGAPMDMDVVAAAEGIPRRGCPDFRRTSVAARCASGCDDLLILHGGGDGSGDLG